MQAKVKASEKLHAMGSVESRARRATFNATPSGKKNFVGENELVDDVASGRVKLDEIDRDHLPAAMQMMAPAEQKAMIEQQVAKRQQIKAQVEALAKKRADFITQEVKASGGAEESLDEKLYDAVRSQAARSGISYDKAESAAY